MGVKQKNKRTNKQTRRRTVLLLLQPHPSLLLERRQRLDVHPVLLLLLLLPAKQGGRCACPGRRRRGARGVAAAVREARGGGGGGGRGQRSRAGGPVRGKGGDDACPRGCRRHAALVIRPGGFARRKMAAGMACDGRGGFGGGRRPFRLARRPARRRLGDGAALCAFKGEGGSKFVVALAPHMRQMDWRPMVSCR